MREESLTRMKVCHDESPELYEMLERLPLSRLARQTALLRVLQAGLAAIETNGEPVLRGRCADYECKGAQAGCTAGRASHRRDQH